MMTRNMNVLLNVLLTLTLWIDLFSTCVSLLNYMFQYVVLISCMVAVPLGFFKTIDMCISRKIRKSMLKSSERKHLKFENMSYSNMFPGSTRAEDVPVNVKEKIDASVASKESKVYAARKLSRFFEIDITIKLLGVEIFSWYFPPVEK